MEISNSLLMTALFVTLLVTTFSTLVALNRIGGFEDMTGMWGVGSATYGAVNLTIQSNLKINFTDDTANFGSGYMCSGCSGSVTLATDGTNDTTCNCGWSIPTGLLLENVGNRYALLNLSNTKTSATFIGGSNPGYAMKWEAEGQAIGDLTGPACNISFNQAAYGVSTNISQYGYAYKNISSVITSNVMCGWFNFSDASDAINFSFKLSIPLNAPAATNEDIWTATATDIGSSV